MEKFSIVEHTGAQATLSATSASRDDASSRPSRPAGKQSTLSRMFWFCAGAGVKYFVILLPFKFLKAHTSLSTLVISGASLAVSTVFFFFWNFFLNFRTDSRPKDALARYLAAAFFMWLLSTAVLSFLKGVSFCSGFKIGKYPVDIDILAMQGFLSGFKFLLYHKWAFPVESARVKREAGAVLRTSGAADCDSAESAGAGP